MGFLLHILCSFQWICCASFTLRLLGFRNCNLSNASFGQGCACLVIFELLCSLYVKILVHCGFGKLGAWFPGTVGFVGTELTVPEIIESHLSYPLNLKFNPVGYCFTTNFYKVLQAPVTEAHHWLWSWFFFFWNFRALKSAP